MDLLWYKQLNMGPEQLFDLNELAFLKSVLESAPIAILCADRSGIICYANGWLERMFQYTRSDLIGKRIEILLPKKSRHLHSQLRQTYVHSPRVREMGSGLELLGVRKDGTNIQVEVGLSYMEVNNHMIVFATVTDISERKQAEKKLVEEQNRMANKLHDSVTQTLFSVGMIADVLPELWRLDPGNGEERLHELRRMTRSALCEMRTMLHELRPYTIEDVELDELLMYLAAIIEGQNRITVDLEVNGPVKLPISARLAFYRVAQESINNVARHAEANHVHLMLDCQSTYTRLLITDDGLGFDPHRVSGKQPGLTIMRTKAEEIGAELLIHSRPGNGTKIDLLWHNSTQATMPEEQSQ